MVQKISSALIQNPPGRNLLINGDMVIDQRNDNLVANLDSTAAVADTNAATTYTVGNATNINNVINTANTFTQGATNGESSAYINVAGLVVGETYKFSMYVKLGTATNLAVTTTNTAVWESFATFGKIADASGGYNTEQYKEISVIRTATATAIDLAFGNNTSTTAQSFGTVFLSQIRVHKVSAKDIRNYSCDRYFSISAGTSPGLVFTDRIIRPGNESRYSSRVTMGTQGTPSNLQYVYGLNQKIEGYHAPKSENFTISFKFISNVTGIFPVGLRSFGDFISSYIHEFQYNVANVEQEVVFTVPNTQLYKQAKTKNPAMWLAIGYVNSGFYQTSTVNKDTWTNTDKTNTDACVNWTTAVGNYIEVTDLQMEEGIVKTPFERKPYNEQLLACQRYYANLGNIYASAYGSLNANSTQVGHFEFPVSMRVTPTVAATYSNCSPLFIGPLTNRHCDVGVIAPVPGNGVSISAIVDAEL